MLRWSLPVVALAGLAGAQPAAPVNSRALEAVPGGSDYAMLVVVSNRVTEALPFCTVTVRARWAEDLYAFNGALFDLVGDPDVGALSSPEALLKAGGSDNGLLGPGGDSVSGIASGQFCPMFGCDPGPCPNPLDIWRATWSTDDFSPRIVSLATITAEFRVFVDDQCMSQSFVDQLSEGLGEIIITCPADCDQSTGLGTLDLFDFLCFVNRFNSGSPDADCDTNGALDIFDFLCFTNAFNAGC